MMTKTQAIALFGDTQVALGRAVNLGRARISQWPEELDQGKVDRVLGAYVRINGVLPERFWRKPRPTRRRIMAAYM